MHADGQTQVDTQTQPLGQVDADTSTRTQTDTDGQTLSSTDLYIFPADAQCTDCPERSSSSLHGRTLAVVHR